VAPLLRAVSALNVYSPVIPSPVTVAGTLFTVTMGMPLDVTANPCTVVGMLLVGAAPPPSQTRPTKKPSRCDRTLRVGPARVLSTTFSSVAMPLPVVLVATTVTVLGPSASARAVL
jgi:hypothetical protein